MESIQNYFPIKKFSLFYNFFVYIDSKTYQADNVFIKHNIKISFVEDFLNPNSSYAMVICKVKKRDITEFKKALSELPNKMLLCGYSDYFEECNRISVALSSHTAGRYGINSAS